MFLTEVPHKMHRGHTNTFSLKIKEQIEKFRRAAVKNVRLGEADGLKNFHPQKWVPNAIK